MRNEAESDKDEGETLEKNYSWSTSTPPTSHPNNPCLPSVCPHTPPLDKNATVSVLAPQKKKINAAVQERRYAP